MSEHSLSNQGFVFTCFVCFLFFRLHFFDASSIEFFIVFASSFASEFCLVSSFMFSRFILSSNRMFLNASSQSSSQMYPWSLSLSVIGV